tara:strand:+ start:325 stop:906 length:582 start_codon:yes stop_codon:yes gene_type:complete
MVWDNVEVPLPAEREKSREIQILKTSWDGIVHANPEFLLLPLYHKIRIPFSLIHDAMLELDAILENVRQQLAGQSRAEWDIFLTTASDYKSSIRKEYGGIGLDLRSSLFVDLPRFLWRVIVRTDEQLQLDLLFDATGIAQHDLLVHVVSSGGGYAQMLGVIAPHVDQNSMQISRQTRSVLKRFLVSSIVPVAA